MTIATTGATDPARDIFKIFSEYASRYAQAHANYFIWPTEEAPSTATALTVLAEVILSRPPRSDVEIIDLLNVVSFFDPAQPWMSPRPFKPVVQDEEYYQVLSELARLVPLPLSAASSEGVKI